MKRRLLQPFVLVCIIFAMANTIRKCDENTSVCRKKTWTILKKFLTNQFLNNMATTEIRILLHVSC